ncbi:neutral zinc metallopeptidase [Antrihabitans cavernicola]|uniref:neutral zinc metallopeptidase n=1 Tax=Antrihabitans cavernicola TaxID=2495913 RepID=UPI001659EDA7|nr:neutral zinc metallopeptidase [Spelaeibacter cavernicola]
MPAPRRESVTSALIVTTLVIFLIGAIAAIKLSGRDSTADTRPAASVEVRTTTPTSTSRTPTPTTTAPTTTAATGLISVEATGSNPLTSTASLATRPCRLPPWATTPQATQVFLDAALDCLNQAWSPVMARLKLPFQPASVVTTADVSTQSCGRPPEESSYYCDGVIYLVPASYLGTNAGPQGIPTAAVSMLAHEYGHHLQQLSGTLAASTKQISDVGWMSPQGLELSRRTELQAQCLSGMFMGTAFDVPSLRMAQQDNYTRGDAIGRQSNHGTPQNFGDWFTKGVQRNSLVSCNTWVATPASVG